MSEVESIAADTASKNAVPAIEKKNIQTGELVAYDSNAELLLAVVTGEQKGKLKVLDVRGKESHIEAKRLIILGIWEVPLLESKEAQISQLQGIEQRAKQVASTISTERFWNSLPVATQSKVEIDTLAKDFFSGEPTLEQRYGLRLAFVQDKIHFKRIEHFFIPRTTEVVQELKSQAEQHQKKQQAIKDFVIWVKAKKLDPALPYPTELRRLKDLLEDCAIESPRFEQRHAKEIGILFNELAEQKLVDNGEREKKLPLPRRSMQFLKNIGLITEETNPAWIRYRPRSYFNEAVTKELQSVQFVSWPEAQLERRDLRQLTCFTVDDASTKDMDDALSFEWLKEGGFRLGVHISDVAGLVLPDTVIEKEAKLRSTSIYSAESTLHMLPEGLSENLASLCEGQERAALSFLFDINEKYEVGSVEIVPSLIKTQQRLTYEHVDKLIERNDPFWQTLSEFCSAHEHKRAQSGARRIGKTEILPVLKREGEVYAVELREIDEQSPARSLVAETAVLANSAAAHFAAQRDIPLVFRGQESGSRDDTQKREEAKTSFTVNETAAEFATRWQLKKSVLSTMPLPHATLGLSCYAQVSSPIRRYLDLLNQRQILHMLAKGVPAYTADEIAKVIEETEPRLGSAASFSKESRRFWLLKYLEQKRMDQYLDGVVVRTDLKYPLVEVEPIFLTLFVNTGAPLQVGQQVRVRVSIVDPQNDYVRLELIA